MFWSQPGNQSPQSLPHTCTRICALQKGSRERMAPLAIQRGMARSQSQAEMEDSPSPRHTTVTIQCLALLFSQIHSCLSATWLRVLFGKHGRHPSITMAPSDVPKGLTDGRSPGTAVGNHTTGSLLGALVAPLLLQDYFELPTSEETSSVGHVRSNVPRRLILYQCSVVWSTTNPETAVRVFLRCHYHVCNTL